MLTTLTSLLVRNGGGGHNSGGLAGGASPSPAPGGECVTAAREGPRVGVPQPVLRRLTRAVNGSHLKVEAPLRGLLARFLAPLPNRLLQGVQGVVLLGLLPGAALTTPL